MTIKDLRKEIKLLIGGTDCGYIRQMILNSRSAFTTEHPDRVINNIYFDSPNLDNYYANMDGLSERSKLRLRWYGTPKEWVESSRIEIKRRHNSYCEKLVEPINEGFSLDSSWDEIVAFINKHADGPFFAALSICPKPMLVNRYHRQYFRSFDGGLRVTIDSDLEYFDTSLSERIDLSIPAYVLPHNIVEIKADLDREPEIKEVIKDLPFLVTKSSKYVMGVQSQLVSEI